MLMTTEEANMTICPFMTRGDRSNKPMMCYAKDCMAWVKDFDEKQGFCSQVAISARLRSINTTLNNIDDILELNNE